MAKIKIYDRELYYDTTDDGIYELRPDGTYQKSHIGGAALVTDADEKSIIDGTTTAGTTYFCYAPAGTASSAAAWKIYKIVDSTGAKTHADGNTNYDNVADNRASLSYS